MHAAVWRRQEVWRGRPPRKPSTGLLPDSRVPAQASWPPEQSERFPPRPGLQTSSQADRRSWGLDRRGGGACGKPDAPCPQAGAPGDHPSVVTSQDPGASASWGSLLQPDVSRRGRLCPRWCREERTPVRVFTQRHVPHTAGRSRHASPSTRSHAWPCAGAPTHMGPMHMSPWASSLHAPCTLTCPRASQPAPEPWAPQESGGPSLPNRTNRLCPGIANSWGERGRGGL